jgi:hypothetical protein
MKIRVSGWHQHSRRHACAARAAAVATHAAARDADEGAQPEPRPVLRVTPPEPPTWPVTPVTPPPTPSTPPPLPGLLLRRNVIGNFDAYRYTFGEWRFPSRQYEDAA